jgi:hypothetical protein
MEVAVQKMNNDLKPRLIDPDDIGQAVAFLRSRGSKDPELTRELVRHFYVDLDELNAVLNQAARPA